MSLRYSIDSLGFQFNSYARYRYILFSPKDTEKVKKERIKEILYLTYQKLQIVDL